jgi:hypothetical protein
MSLAGNLVVPVYSASKPSCVYVFQDLQPIKVGVRSNNRDVFPTNELIDSKLLIYRKTKGMCESKGEPE